MVKDRRIQWRTFTKTPPVYLIRISCHDPKVFKGNPKGIRYSLRIKKKTQLMKRNKKLWKCIAASGYNYQTVKNELKKFENVDPRV